MPVNIDCVKRQGGRLFCTFIATKLRRAGSLVAGQAYWSSSASTMVKDAPRLYSETKP